MDKTTEIRDKEREYHNNCYENNILFGEGSWLSKPVQSVLDSFELVSKTNNMTILDLGCGVGRNTIPLAKKLKGSKGKVVAIDVLPLAIKKLNEYAMEYDVSEYIEPIISSIEEFEIIGKYDFVLAVSVLEHLDSKNTLKQKLVEISKNTKPGGVNCIIMNTEVREKDKDDNSELIPQFEINMETEEAYLLLDEIYNDWNIKKRFDKQYKFDINRGSSDVVLDTTVVTYVVRKDRG